MYPSINFPKKVDVPLTRAILPSTKSIKYENKKIHKPIIKYCLVPKKINNVARTPIPPHKYVVTFAEMFSFRKNGVMKNDKYLNTLLDIGREKKPVFL